MCLGEHGLAQKPEALTAECQRCQALADPFLGGKSYVTTCYASVETQVMEQQYKELPGAPAQLNNQLMAALVPARPLLPTGILRSKLGLKKGFFPPWPVWLSWLEHCPTTKRSPV